MYDTETEVEMPWVYNDGGYKTAGFKAKHGNSIVAAIAIVTGQRYGEVYDELAHRQIELVRRSRRNSKVKKYADKHGAGISKGIWPDVYKQYLADLGWAWTPIMKIGSGTTVHMTYEEVPDHPVMLLSISKDMAAVVNGIVQSTYDKSRDGTRAVYGFWTPGS